MFRSVVHASENVLSLCVEACVNTSTHPDKQSYFADVTCCYSNAETFSSEPPSQTGIQRVIHSVAFFFFFFLKESGPVVCGDSHNNQRMGGGESVNP